MLIFFDDQGEDKLLVGCKDGALLSFKILEKEGNSDITSLDAENEFSKKPVTQLNVIEEQNLLVSCSGGYINVHNIGYNNYSDTVQIAPRTQISKSKGCIFYSLDQIGKNYFLSVILKKRLIIFQLLEKEFVFQKEMVLPDTPNTITLTGESICVGYKKGYSLLNLSTSHDQFLFPLEKGTPIISKLPNRQLLLSKDTSSIVIGFDGKPTKKFTISWTESPLDFKYCFPYLIGLMSKVIEVRTFVSNSNTIQFIPIKALFISCKGDSIYLANQSSIFKLSQIPLLSQISQLVEEKLFEDALNLLSLLPPSLIDPQQKQTKISLIQTQHAYSLFSKGNFFLFIFLILLLIFLIKLYLMKLSF